MLSAKHTKYLVAVVVFCASPITVSPAAERTLTVADARRLAVEFNRQYLSSQEEVIKAGAEVTKARAGAFPSVNVLGNYNRNFDIPSFFVQAGDETIEFKAGFKNSYNASLVVDQSIWQGGKVWTAWSIARDYRKYADASAAQARSEVIYRSEVLFYGLILEQSRLVVLQKSYEAASQNLVVVEKQYSQGIVSEFELLRARVEKSNLEPEILQAESDLRLVEKRLKSFLGLELSDTILVVEDPVDTSLARLPSLDESLAIALEKRPEMQEAGHLREISRKAVKIARAGYWPSLSAQARYDWQSQSDDFTLHENISKTWSAGLSLQIPVFNGGLTRGEVTQALADHRVAMLHESQVRDDVRLEVEGAHDRVVQARQALEVQRNTIAQAEEGLRIANLRYESGVGTLLEVLSAQAALTQARRIEAEAKFAFRRARAGLKLATTVDLDELK